jgi:hypothetical protein
MRADQPSTAERESGRAALAAALDAHFAAGRLGAESASYLYGSMLPTLVLWFHSWHHLPDLVAWFAALAWATTGVVGTVLAAVSWSRRRDALRALPEAQRVVRVTFAPDRDTPITSSLLLLVALLLSGVLGLHGFVPTLLRADTVVVGGRAWLILAAGTWVNRWLESSF